MPPRTFRAFIMPQKYWDAHTGLTLQIAPDQARYLGTVLRKKAGDHVRIFNANSGEWLARITEIRKDKGFFELERQLRAPTQQPALVLAFALLKRDATDLVLRIGTELGVTHFMPLLPNAPIHTASTPTACMLLPPKLQNNVSALMCHT